MIGPSLEYVNYTWDPTMKTINRLIAANQSYLLADGVGNISSCPYLRNVTSSLTVKNYTNDGNSSNDDFTPDASYPFDLQANSYTYTVTSANLITLSYPANFTLTTRSYPADFNLTITPACPAP